jgi:cytochrome c
MLEVLGNAGCLNNVNLLPRAAKAPPVAQGCEASYLRAVQEVTMRSLIIAAVAATLPISALAAAPDGKAIFAARCAGCHALTAKSGPAGPQLKGVLGRKIAGAADFNYSAGLKAKTGGWAAQSLDSYLTAPATFAPGTKMFARLADPAERAAVIAYLKTVQ